MFRAALRGSTRLSNLWAHDPDHSNSSFFFFSVHGEIGNAWYRRTCVGGIASSNDKLMWGKARRAYPGVLANANFLRCSSAWRVEFRRSARLAVWTHYEWLAPSHWPNPFYFREMLNTFHHSIYSDGTYRIEALSLDNSVLLSRIWKGTYLYQSLTQA